MKSFNVQFYCRESKKTKNGTAPLEIAINLNGVRKFINLPYKCYPQEFNRKKQPKELVEYQVNMRKRVNECLNEILAKGEPLTVEKITDYIKTGGYKTYTVEDLFDEYISILEKRVGSTLTKSVFSKYLLVRDLFYTIIDKSADSTTIAPFHVKTFKAICESKYKTSTVGGYLQKLKTILTYGMDNAHIKVNPFTGTKISKGETNIEYLTEEELKYIAELKIENNSLRNARDYFLFECYSGISYCDIMNIDANDIKEDNGVYYIVGKRQKTGKEFTSVLLPGFEKLVVNFDNNLGNNFVLYPDNQGVRKYFRFKKVKIQKINAYLHAIENIYNVPKKLTTHLGRKTYAVLLANKYKCRMELVASALGDSLKITTKHYAKFLRETTVSEIGAQLKIAE